MKRLRPWMLAAGLGVAALIGSMASAPVLAAPPQGMPDPTEMSGIPRPDPNLAPDVITVRCLDGSFANPALGVAVELELTAPDGTKTIKTLTSAEQGRVRFEGLEDHYGHTAVARATVAGQALTSQTFTLTGQTGFALMLVAKGTGTPAGAPAPHGGQGEVPMPGKPFALADRPRGSLVVGALDLGEGGGPIASIEITLTATVPGVVEPILLTATTDADGRASFDALDTKLPEGAAIVVSANLGEAELERSESFVLGPTGYAIVLTKNEDAVRPPQPQPAAPERQVVFPPRADRSLQPGQIRVLVIGADDQPVANQPVNATASSITGDKQIRVGTTNAGGEAILEFPTGDLLAEVRTSYAGAPWTSGGFSLPSDSGAMAILRVFETTADRSIARSAIQIDVLGRENDFASVTLMVAVFIEGDLAFWPAGGMRIFGPEGTRSLQVLPEAEEWLVHDGEAPWVDLSRPLPPGVEIRLSFAVGLDHDGSLELDWTTPFPLVDGASLVTVPPELKVSHGVAGAPETNPHAGRDGGPLDIYRLGHERFEAGLCDRFGTSGHRCPFEAQLGNDLAIVVEGLPIRSRVWPWTAWTLIGLTGLGVLMALALRPRVGVREALLARRDALMLELVALDSSQPPAAEVDKTRKRLLASLDRIYRQLDVTGA